MSNRVFYGILALLTAGLIGVAYYGKAKEPTKPPTLGTQYAEVGTDHVAEGTQSKYNSNPPSSGDMFAQTIPKGFYDQEYPDGNLIHNLEHGYVWVAYRPDLPKDQVQKLKGLFSSPFSNPKFNPSKAIVTQRSANPAPISIVSWRWTMNLNSYDEKKLMDFYLQHVSRSPEGASP